MYLEDFQTHAFLEIDRFMEKLLEERQGEQNKEFKDQQINYSNFVRFSKRHLSEINLQSIRALYLEERLFYSNFID
jgi:hypothetical protein